MKSALGRTFYLFEKDREDWRPLAVSTVLALTIHVSNIILGISAFYHDSAAALVRDGEIVAAAQEERFSRKKHDPRFPRHAVNYCLSECFIEPSDIAVVAFYDNSSLTIDRAVRNFVTVAPDGESAFAGAMTSLLGDK